VVQPSASVEHPVAAQAASTPVELRVQVAAGIYFDTTSGRLADGRLVVNFAGYAGTTRGRPVLLQRKQGARFVTVARGRTRGGGMVDVKAIAPRAGSYRFLWISPDRRRWADSPSALHVYRR
jgi:hypothetical protein